MTKHPKTA